MIQILRALASLPRRWTCETCGDRFHLVQHKAIHIDTHHAGDPAPTEGQR